MIICDLFYQHPDVHPSELLRIESLKRDQNLSIVNEQNTVPVQLQMA